MCLYGGDTTVRLKQLGMEFAVWTFKHATEASLTSVAAFTFKQLLSLLDEGACMQRSPIPMHAGCCVSRPRAQITEDPCICDFYAVSVSPALLGMLGPQLYCALVAASGDTLTSVSMSFNDRVYEWLYICIPCHAADVPPPAAQSARPTWPAARSAASPTRPSDSWRRGCPAWRGSGSTSRRCDQLID